MIPVNVVLRFDVAAGPDDQGAEYMAIGHWVLPGIPRADEEIIVLDHRARVDKVQWGEGKLAVYIKRFRASVEVLTTLENEGWEVAPWQDEPPSEWFGGP